MKNGRFGAIIKARRIERGFSIKEVSEELKRRGVRYMRVRTLMDLEEAEGRRGYEHLVPDLSDMLDLDQIQLYLELGVLPRNLLRDDALLAEVAGLLRSRGQFAGPEETP